MPTETEKIQAQQDLLNKLKFEKVFKTEIRSLFARMRNEYKRVVAATGRIPSFRKYLPDWNALLRKHYTRVQNSVMRNIINQNKQNEPDIEDIILLALIDYSDRRAPEQARIITETNIEQSNDALGEAQNALIEEGEEINNINLAAVSSLVLSRKFGGRVDSIAITETQAPFENTKFTVSSEIGRRLDETKYKTWVTVGDDRVRQTHRSANGQRVETTRPFIVGNSLLMYPSDSSLGASVSELINCRCSAQYDFTPLRSFL